MNRYRLKNSRSDVAIECPKCGAAPGMHCTGKAGEDHRSRVLLYEQILKDCAKLESWNLILKGLGRRKHHE